MSEGDTEVAVMLKLAEDIGRLTDGHVVQDVLAALTIVVGGIICLAAKGNEDIAYDLTGVFIEETGAFMEDAKFGAVGEPEVGPEPCPE